MWTFILIKKRVLRSGNVTLKILVLCLISGFVYCMLGLMPDKKAVELSFYKDNVKFLDGLNATECKIPDYDIYDPEVLKYVNKPPTPIFCGRMQPYLTHLDWDGVLHLNKTEVDANYYNFDIKCHYQKVTLNKDDDYIPEYGDKVDIVFPMKITDPTLRVECLRRGSKIYSMVHAQIKPWSPEKIERNKEIPSHRPSVLIFTIDSMSRGNFIRTLPLTYNYLVRKLRMTILKGLNKVADNTFPNMMALLAGFATLWTRGRGLNLPVWTPSMNSTIKGYDEMPIVWKSLGEQGYVTMYCEEYLDTIYSYVDYGFREDPVDYYYRAPYVALKDTLANIKLNKLKFWDRSKWRYCLGNEPSYKYMLNYTEEFLTEMRDLRYFALSFFVEMSHEYLTDVTNMDKDVYNFFLKMFSNGHFDNTVVLVMGDHGHRFDGIRSTYVGRLEERMPLLGIILPNKLKKKYPHLQKSLDSHTEKLLSWFDIHQTLLDIVDDDLEEVPTKSRPNAVGRSIFRPFDENRTCTQIGILPEYCVCDRESQIPVNSEKAVLSADVAVKQINLLLADSSKYLHEDESRSCAYLYVKNITLAYVSMKSSSTESFSMLVRVMFYTTPSQGMFEAAVEYKPEMEPAVLGDINRINKYGDQPSCISHEILRLYCYCVEQ